MTTNSPDHFDEAPGGLTFMARLKSGASTAIGATVALGIIFTLGVWFYRLGDRDARNVPIIRADGGPVKRIPDDPGGAKTPHQGITSYSAGDGATASAGAAVIAPEPVEPKRDDVAMGELKPAGAEDAAPTTDDADEGTAVTDPLKAEIARAVDKITPRDAAVAEAPADDDPEERSTAPEDATEAPVRARQDEAEEKVAALDTDATGDASTIPDEEIRFPGSSEFAPDRSPSAPRRPVNLVARSAAAAKSAETAATDLIERAASSPFQIQLAADPDKSAIVKMWGRISKSNADVLRGRALAIQTTVSGGTTYYRLRVGPFATRSEATSVCQALKARKQDCIVAGNS